ncbi:MAG TPA: NAD(P)/FAD-dependent oxidoreductase [Gaiellaceae bacterium]|nr:NAD(P)/FAD-dependent oxidoreductase [Gaiellaceae bacterium]
MAGDRYDAIVVGAGHNGLVTAAYLAKAGLRTLVLERRERAGGLLTSEEIAPGVRTPVADGVDGLRAGVVQDLGLGAHGFRAVEPDAVAFAPSADGPGLTLWRDPVRTATELRAGPRPRDADAFVAFDGKIRSLAGFLARLQATEPPDLESPSLADATTGLSLLNALRHLGRPQIREALRVLPMSVADLVSESVEDEALRGALGARGIRHAAMGPRSAGTALNFLWDSASGDGGAAGRTVFARGGPGALAEALVAAARARGAEVRCGAAVAAIRTAGGSVEGVTLESGEEIDARLVASSADPKRTLLSLLDPAETGPTLGWRAEHIRTPGVVAKVTLVLEGLPAIGGADDERLHGRIVIAPTLDDLEVAFNDSKYGRISESPYLEATIPTLSDPSLAPEGTHVVSVLFQYAPRELRDSDWDEAASGRVAEATVRTLEAHAPGLEKRIVARRVLTPADLEREYSLSGGHPMHGELALDQFFAWRPLLGHARYRLAEIDGLYLCGAGAHPGGGITGGPGQNAARAILADARRARRRRARPGRGTSVHIRTTETRYS